MGLKREWKPTWDTTPEATTAATMVCTSANVGASGFSHMTALPARTALTTVAAWVAVGPVTRTASTSGWSATSDGSPLRRSKLQFLFVALRASSEGSAAITARISPSSASLASPSAWICPIDPQPTIPTPTDRGTVASSFRVSGRDDTGRPPASRSRVAINGG